MTANGSGHTPVLLREVIQGLDPKPNQNVFDGTVGAGGHAAAILERTSPDGKLLGMDLDEAALDAARRTLARFDSRAMLVRGNYRDCGRVLLSRSFGPVHAALLDLGFSSLEIDDPRRGFSFRNDGPLDMRYDASQELTAAEIVNHASPDELSRILWEYGEERYARHIAVALVSARRRDRIIGTLQLADIIGGAVPGHYRKGKIHPATKTFQALRIAVNDELGNVRTALPVLLDALEPGGRLAVISFHSLEDRIVKTFFQEKSSAGAVTVLTKKPVAPGEDEVRDNPRSRSAKLRIAMKK